MLVIQTIDELVRYVETRRAFVDRRIRGTAAYELTRQQQLFLANDKGQVYAFDEALEAIRTLKENMREREEKVKEALRDLKKQDDPALTRILGALGAFGEPATVVAPEPKKGAGS